MIDLELARPQLYHATGTELVTGTVLSARPRRDQITCAETIELYRPRHMIARDRAIYLTDDPGPKNLIKLGVDWTYCYRVETSGKVERHSMRWLDRVHWLLSHHGLAETDARVKSAADAYWRGDLYRLGKQRWEYLAVSITITGLESYNPYEE